MARTVLVQQCLRRVARGVPLGPIRIRGPDQRVHMYMAGASVRDPPSLISEEACWGSIATSMRLAQEGRVS